MRTKFSRNARFACLARLGFGVARLGFVVAGLGFEVPGLGFGVARLGFGVAGLGFEVCGLGFFTKRPRVQIAPKVAADHMIEAEIH